MDGAQKNGDGFVKLDDDPYLIRCYSHRALGEGTAVGRNTASPGKALVSSDEMPMSGQQEILFFDDDFGLVVSDLVFERDFDYELVQEDLNFYHFRLNGHAIERVSNRHEPVLVSRPGFKLTAPPNGHLENSRMLTASGWRSVTPFLGPDTARHLFGPEEDLLDCATTGFREWQLRNGVPMHALSSAMTDVLTAILACPFHGKIRRSYLEAKSIELMCLAIAVTRDRLHADAPTVSQPDRLRLQAARDIIDRRFDDPPTLAELGRMVGLNRRKLATGFRECFGTSILQYCLTRRMRIARDLLDEGMAISLIADRMGYADQSSFSRAFLRHHGAPPGFFRLS